jgi:hypothetical protein
VSGCEVLLAVVSPAYVQSKSCGLEMALCKKYKRTLIPLMVGYSPQNWPPTHVGDVAMQDQFRDPDTGDTRLYVDFTDVEKVRADPFLAAPSPQ